MRKLLCLLVASMFAMIPSRTIANQSTTVMPTVNPHPGTGFTMTEFTNSWLNPALLSLLSNSSGATAPANGPGNMPTPWQFWMDTSGSTINWKIYDGAQWIPIESINPTTHSGIPQSPALPGLTDNVQGTGIPGLNNPISGWMLYIAPTNPTLNNPLSVFRVQRDANYAGNSGGVNYAAWVACNVSAGVQNFEFCGLDTVNNLATDVGTNIVARYSQAFKQAGASSTWPFVYELRDYGPNTMTGSVGMEGDLWGRDGDVNSLRIIADLVGGPIPGTVASGGAVTITIASPAVVTLNSHGLLDEAPVNFSTTGALPTGITAGVIYYVKNPTPNTFQISLTPGGDAINTSGSQSGMHTVGASHAPVIGRALRIGAAFGNAYNATFKKGITFGPAQWTGCLICGEGVVNAVNGIDLTGVAFSGYPLKLTNFQVDGIGNLTTFGVVALGRTGPFSFSVAGEATFYDTVIASSLSLGTPGAAPGAGKLGEEIESSIPIGSAVTMTSTTPANITSVNITAGNWLCYGSISTAPDGGTTTSAIFGAISDTSATFPTAPNDGAWVSDHLSTPAGASVTHPVGQRIYRTASPMTVYLVATYNFTGGTMGGYGYLGCFRQP